jgi:hypothetical protein
METPRANVSDALGDWRNAVVDIILPQHRYDRLPSFFKEKNAAEGSPVYFSLIPILLVQGINEKHKIGLAMKHTSISVQKNSNIANIGALDIYTEYYKTYYSDDLSLELISVKVRDFKEKIMRSTDMNSCYCTYFEQIIAELHGMRMTSCKSAKDRTSMAVTLENIVFLKEKFQITSVAETLELMRCYGVRMENVRKNIGRYAYCFNNMQKTMLPLEYRPRILSRK